MRVVVDKSVLKAYVRRALKAYPNEFLATLWGKVVDAEIQIHLITHIDHIAGPAICVFDSDEFSEQDKEAREIGLRWLGTIHSHPQDCAAPSVADVETASADGELVLGICSITKEKDKKRRRVDVRFWPVVTPHTTKIT